MRNATAKTLLAEIEAFLARTGATPTKLGLAAVNDGHLVANLRKGHSITLKTADKVRAYMSRHAGRDTIRAGARAGRNPQGRDLEQGLHAVSHTEADTVDRPVRRRIVLVIGGGIAAYKCLDLIRRLRERLAVEVLTVMTRAAQEFVTPLSVGALSNAPVSTELFDLDAEREIGHIRLARDADLVVVAPATADLIAKMAGGHGRRPRHAAPARHRQAGAGGPGHERAHVARSPPRAATWPARGRRRPLRRPGRRARWPAARPAPAAWPSRRRSSRRSRTCWRCGRPQAAGPLAGRHVLVTSGPDARADRPGALHRQPLLGQAGHADRRRGAGGAGRARHAGLGPRAPPPRRGVDVVRGRDRGGDAGAPCARRCPPTSPCSPPPWPTGASPTPRRRSSRSARPRARRPGSTLVENPDILRTIAGRRRAQRPPLVVGFAAETESVVDNARAKRKAQGLRLDRGQRRLPRHRRDGRRPQHCASRHARGRRALARASTRPRWRAGSSSGRCTGSPSTRPRHDGPPAGARTPCQGGTAAVPGGASPPGLPLRRRRGLDLVAAVDAPVVLRPGRRALIPRA